MKSFDHGSCPRCDYHRLVRWDDLDDEQKVLVERLPGSSEYAVEERKKHRFCTRCWFEEKDKLADLA